MLRRVFGNLCEFEKRILSRKKTRKERRISHCFFRVAVFQDIRMPFSVRGIFRGDWIFFEIASASGNGLSKDIFPRRSLRRESGGRRIFGRSDLQGVFAACDKKDFRQRKKNVACLRGNPFGLAFRRGAHFERNSRGLERDFRGACFEGLRKKNSRHSSRIHRAFFVQRAYAFDDDFRMSQSHAKIFQSPKIRL